jgi:hypothetical protein
VRQKASSVCPSRSGPVRLSDPAGSAGRPRRSRLCPLTRKRVAFEVDRQGSILDSRRTRVGEHPRFQADPAGEQSSIPGGPGRRTSSIPGGPGRRTTLDSRRTRQANIPFEAFACDLGTFASWGVTNYPRLVRDGPFGTLSRCPLRLPAAGGVPARLGAGGVPARPPGRRLVPARPPGRRGVPARDCPPPPPAKYP